MPDSATGDMARLIATLEAELDDMDDAESLRRGIRWVIEQALRREQDRDQRVQTLAAVDGFFSSQPAGDLARLRGFCKQVVSMAVDKRPSRAAALAGGRMPAAAPDGAAPVEAVPEVVPPPYPTRHDGFADLLAAALVYRVRCLTTFFQRRNPYLRRVAAPPFLLSPEFDARLETVIVDQIAPAMMGNARFTGALEHGRQWRRVSTEEFWAIVAEGNGLEDRLLSTWMEAWNGLKPRPDAKGGKPVPPAGLTRLRRTLAAGDPPAYALPRIGGDQINLFGRLLSDLRGEMEGHWSVLGDLYRQEIEHPRHGDGHRAGATMDALTALLPALPGRLGEYVAILCHYNFAGIDTVFLRRVADASSGTTILSSFLADGAGI